MGTRRVSKAAAGRYVESRDCGFTVVRYERGTLRRTFTYSGLTAIEALEELAENVNRGQSVILCWNVPSGFHSENVVDFLPYRYRAAVALNAVSEREPEQMHTDGGFAPLEFHRASRPL